MIIQKWAKDTNEALEFKKAMEILGCEKVRFYLDGKWKNVHDHSTYQFLGQGATISEYNLCCTVKVGAHYVVVAKNGGVVCITVLGE